MMNYSAADMAFILLCISLNNNDNNHDIKNNALTFGQHEERRKPQNIAQLRDETPLAWTCRFFFFFPKISIILMLKQTLKNGLTASEVWEFCHI